MSGVTVVCHRRIQRSEPSFKLAESSKSQFGEFELLQYERKERKQLLSCCWNVKPPEFICSYTLFLVLKLI